MWESNPTIASKKLQNGTIQPQIKVNLLNHYRSAIPLARNSSILWTDLIYSSELHRLHMEKVETDETVIVSKLLRSYPSRYEEVDGIERNASWKSQWLHYELSKWLTWNDPITQQNLFRCSDIFCNEDCMRKDTVLLAIENHEGKIICETVNINTVDYRYYYLWHLYVICTQ